MRHSSIRWEGSVLLQFLTARRGPASRRRQVRRPVSLAIEPLGPRQMLAVTPSITSASLFQGPVTGGNKLQLTGANFVNAAGQSLVQKVRFYDSTTEAQNSEGQWYRVYEFLTDVSSANVTMLPGGKAAAATIQLTVPDFSAVTSWGWGPKTFIGQSIPEWPLRVAVTLKDGSESASLPYTVFYEPNGGGSSISASVATTTVINVGDKKSTQTQDAPSDRDWWKVSLKKDTEYVFKVEASNPIWSGNWKYSPDLVIRDSKGNAISAVDRIQPGNGRLLAGVSWNKTYTAYFDPPADGDYFLDVGGSGVTWTYYDLSAAKATYVSDWTTGSKPVTDDYSSNPSTKGTVAVGGTVTAKVDVSGDRDWFKVTLKKGEKYRFTAKPTGLASNSGPYWTGSWWDQVTIKLHDASGKWLSLDSVAGDSYSETWPNGDPDKFYGSNQADLVFTAPAAGTYYVDVGPGARSFRGFYGEGYGVGSYELSMRTVPTYAIRPSPPTSQSDKSIISEGGVLTSTVSTTSVPADTKLYWAVSGTGVTAGDFSSGALTGSGTVDKAGKFSFSHTIAKDQTTEGSETLEVSLFTDDARTVQVGTTASIRIVDTSRTPSYEARLGTIRGVTFTPVEFIQEGAAFTARLLVKNPPIDTVYYKLSGTGITAGDFSVGKLTGSGKLSNGGTSGGDSLASLSVPLTLARDKVTEGDEGLQVAFYSDAACTVQLGAAATVTIIDKSTAAPPTYLITTPSAPADEGTAVSVTAATTNVDPGTVLYWAVSGTGVTAADLAPASLTGTTKAGDDTASFAVTFVNDQMTEGEELLQIKLFSDAARTKQVGNSVAVMVRDTSRTPAYTLTPSLASVDEGAALSTKVSTANVAVGTQLYWALTGAGITAADFSAGGPTGSGTVGGDGTFVIAHTVAGDKTTEGDEVLQIKLFSDAARTKQAGATASVTIKDTSKTPTYTLTPSLAKADEGVALSTTVATTNLPVGVELFWSLSGTGITAADFSAGGLTGTGTVGGDGTFVIAHTVASDQTTEGSETLQIKLFTDAARTKQAGATASVTINDTSKTPPYTITPSLASVDEGGVLTTTVATNGIAAGTQLFWSLSGTGITADDFSTGALTGAGTTASDGTFSFVHAVARDKTTETDEILQIKLFSDAARTKQVGTTASVTVKDTSLFSTAFDGAQLPVGLGLDVPSAAHASITLDTANKELDFNAFQTTDMWDTRNNAPIAWVNSPVVPVGGSWAVETHVRLVDRTWGGQMAGIVFYGADGERPAFTFGIDGWPWWTTGVHLLGVGKYDPDVWADLFPAHADPVDNVFLRVVVTENGATDRYDFYYKLKAGDSWTLLKGGFDSDAANGRVGLFYKTSEAKPGASFNSLNLARVS